jgi:hypothetical protein
LPMRLFPRIVAGARTALVAVEMIMETKDRTKTTSMAGLKNFSAITTNVLSPKSPSGTKIREASPMPIGINPKVR